MKNNYKWEAEKIDGTIMTEGGNLKDVRRFSLIPNVSGIPRHDFIGVKMLRRFSRGFCNGFSGELREYVHCIVFETHRIYVRTNGQLLLTPKDYELYL